jgi:hypothetical protein
MGFLVIAPRNLEAPSGDGLRRPVVEALRREVRR